MRIILYILITSITLTACVNNKSSVSQTKQVEKTYCKSNCWKQSQVNEKYELAVNISGFQEADVSPYILNINIVNLITNHTKQTLTFNYDNALPFNPDRVEPSEGYSFWSPDNEFLALPYNNSTICVLPAKQLVSVGKLNITKHCISMITGIDFKSPLVFKGWEAPHTLILRGAKPPYQTTYTYNPLLGIVRGSDTAYTTKDPVFFILDNKRFLMQNGTTTFIRSID